MREAVREAVALSALALAACTPEGLVAQADDGRASVVEVVDGDTIVVDVGGAKETIRLLGIDTPETVAPDRPVECFGPEASSRTAALLPQGAPVRLERDREARDRYHRLLAYVFLEGDTMVNEVLVAEGLATVLHIEPNDAYAGRLSAAERAARDAGLGLWSACPAG